LLDSADLAAWSRRGIEVGAHTRTHARLTALTSDDVVAEMDVSKQELERMVGAPVVTFAYPFGAVDQRVREAASARFDAAFTIEQELNTLAAVALMLRA